MDYKRKFNYWLTDPFFDKATRQELAQLQNNPTEIQDRFYKDLEFGTGGLRGIMGAGTNRMNKYTVGKATYGFGAFLKSNYSEEACRVRGVVIGYDTRNNSKFFTEVAASEKRDTYQVRQLGD